MKQGTKEWLEWRLNGIGASDAPIVMGASPWSTPFKLWQIKTRQVETAPANAAMQRGSDLEPIARMEFQKLTGIEMPPATVEHPKHNFIRASLDGLNGKQALEIKCPGRVDHATAVSGKIPDKYLYQLAHQCMAGDLEKIHYFSFDGKSGVVVPYHRDEKIEKSLFEREEEFWWLVKAGVPPEAAEKDFEIVTFKEMVDLCELYKANKEMLDKLEAEQKRLKDALTKQANGNPILCAGLSISTHFRKGGVDYAKIPQLKGIDLEPFRKSPISVVNFRIKKG